jgi:hypothetical protein
MTGRELHDEWIGKTPRSRPTWACIERLLEKQGHRCAGPCHQKIGPGNGFDADHIVELKDGGENRESNLQLLCRKVCHKTKSRVRAIARANDARTRQHLAGWKVSKHIMPGSRRSIYKKKLNGQVVLRDVYDDDGD